MITFAVIVVIVVVTALILIERDRKSDLDDTCGYTIHESFQERQARKIREKKING